jgi:hypothetical protein
MPIVNVRGINFGDVKDFTDDKLQDLRGTVRLVAEPANKFDTRAIAVRGKVKRGSKWTSVRLGYVDSSLLNRAHREHWVKWGWEIEEIGRFRPRYATTVKATTQVFCKLSDRSTHLLNLVSSDEDDSPSLLDSLQNDASMYDGHTCVCIHYDSESSGLGWRDVILLEKTDDGFLACDGSSDHRGRPIPQKRFKFARLQAARCVESLDDGEDEALSPTPAKRAKLA